MANQEHVDILKQGVEVWNQWREETLREPPDLSQADLSGIDLSNADLGDANLRGTVMVGTNLTHAIIADANLSGANLSHANLSYANLDSSFLNGTSLSGANLTGAFLAGTQIYSSDLNGTDFSFARAGRTVFEYLDLRQARGLEAVEHDWFSHIDTHTLELSQGEIPRRFLQGVGVSETMIDILHLLIEKVIEFYSCFISYSSKDEELAKCLYADLQAAGVRCWFAPEDMKIGDRIRPRINESIRIYDKLLLVLSEHSVASKWVEFEVEAAMDKEQEGKPPVLFPVRLDNKVMESTTAWAAHIKGTRHIGDFTHWKDHDAYQKAFDRLLRDLKAEG